MNDKRTYGQDRLALEEHLDGAAAMTRTLWRLLENDGLFVDIRDAIAIRALAAHANDHAEHARGIYGKLTRERGDV